MGEFKNWLLNIQWLDGRCSPSFRAVYDADALKCPLWVLLWADEPYDCPSRQALETARWIMRLHHAAEALAEKDRKANDPSWFK